MKATIAILSVVLCILLALMGIILFGGGRESSLPTPSDTAMAAPTEPPTTEPPTTEPPTTEPPTTEPETEPEPEFSPAELTVILEGQEIGIWENEGAFYLRASEFAELTGLTEGPEVLLTGDDTLELEGKALTVNGSPLPAEALSAGGEIYLPYPALTEALNYPTWLDEESGVTYITPSARPFEIPEGINIPVLMYHAVSDYMWGINELFVSPSELEKQLSYLAENGYDPIWFEDLAHLEDYDKPVILTFDDGYDDNYTELFPLLQKYDTKATVFMITNDIGGNHKLTADQLREMSASGLVSIQSHTCSHNYLDGLGEKSLERELGDSKNVLTRITGKIPYVLCYPTGHYNSLTLEVGARYYLFGIKMNGGLYNTSDNPFLVNRYYISRYTDLNKFIADISAAGTE